MPDHVHTALGLTDWKLFAAQKLALIEAIKVVDEHAYRKHLDQLLQGLLAWVDAIQDAAEKEGHEVVWLEDKE
jgi:hypothetical protein